MDRSVLVAALDDLTSLSTCHSRKKRALSQLESFIAEACAPSTTHSSSPRLPLFLHLQDSFECNIASRLLTFIALSLPFLQNPGEDSRRYDNAYYCVAQSMSLIQGVALLHAPSKTFLSAKWAIEVFLTLLRCPQPAEAEAEPPTPVSPTKSSSPANSQTATSLPLAIVDALLCILVDAPQAIRSFEELKGLEVIVKCLKKSGLPKDVRMKCLEFLYWYLLPEDTPPQRSHSGASLPASPIKATPAPLHITTSWPGPSTRPLTARPTPELETPPRSPTKPTRTALLRRELDFIPTTPKKVHAPRIVVGTPRTQLRSTATTSPPGTPNKKRTAALAVTRSEARIRKDSENIFTGPPISVAARQMNQLSRHTRSTEEKKALLGDLLGNVDVLVEGVCKAGIWGLG